jgi:hypothetical protein
VTGVPSLHLPFGWSLKVQVVKFSCVHERAAPGPSASGLSGSGCDEALEDGVEDVMLRLAGGELGIERGGFGAVADEQNARDSAPRHAWGDACGRDETTRCRRGR